MARKSFGEILYNGKRYLSLNLAASQCGYHKEYLRQLIKAGKLNGERIKDLWFIEKDVFAIFCKKNDYINNNYRHSNVNTLNNGLLQEIWNIKNELAEVKSTVLIQQTSIKTDPWDRLLLGEDSFQPKKSSGHYNFSIFKPIIVKALSVVLIILASVFFTRNFDAAIAGLDKIKQITEQTTHQTLLAAVSLQETASETALNLKQTALNLPDQVRSLSLSLLANKSKTQPRL